MTIPSGIIREDVLAALEDLDGGIEHSFGDSTKYDLVHKDRRYPPKAVVGLAARRVHGSVLRNDDFNGGDAPGSANPVLRDLGFTIVPKDGGQGSDGMTTDTQHIASTL
ncbi:MAG: hypothetical protein M5U23_13760 [Acidimicrobiia bacterium]|nr:hypothetical protein [Acidimicrobiia bacterium]